jgi:phosphoserine phosphatase
MSFTIEFPLDTERKIQAEAAKLDIMPEEYLRRVVEGALPAKPVMTAASELVAQWRAAGLVGAWAGRDIRDSVAYAQALRKSAESRPVS